MTGVWYRTLYKLLGSTIIDECNSYVVHAEGGKYDSTLTTPGGNTVIFHQILGHIRENVFWALQGKDMV